MTDFDRRRSAGGASQIDHRRAQDRLDQSRMYRDRPGDYSKKEWMDKNGSHVSETIKTRDSSSETTQKKTVDGSMDKRGASHGKTTDSITTERKDGSVYAKESETQTMRNRDGSGQQKSTVWEGEVRKDGSAWSSKTVTDTKVNRDGSSTSRKTEEKTNSNKDGSSTESKTVTDSKTNKDGDSNYKITDTYTQKNSEGKVVDHKREERTGSADKYGLTNHEK
mgnify:CR=1 FL=1